MAGKKAKPRKTAKKLELGSLKPSDVLCPICRTILIEPVTLSCNHAFCKLCFEGTMENANLVCPLCRIRVGSWLRKAKKEGKLVDEVLWEAIQTQYPTEVKNRYQGIDNVIEEDVPVIVVATPGEIRKEYEQQRQKELEEQKKLWEAEEKASAPLIKKLREEEELKKTVEEEKLRLDAALAKKLAEDLERPTTSKFLSKITAEKKKLASSKRYGPMDKFIKIEDTKLSRQLLNKAEEHKSLYKGGLRRISTTPNPACDFATKEYTCRVLNAESHIQAAVNSSSILNKYKKPSYTGGVSTAQKKVRQSRKGVESAESICKSGYKSSGSGSDDAIDQECRFYFKPIDTQRRHHLPGTIPIKVPTQRGKKASNAYIGPPTGKIINIQLGTVISAFARFSMVLQSQSQNPSTHEVVDETSNGQVGLSNRLKRKLSNMDSPVKRKERRQVSIKKNIQNADKRKIVSSPLYGFDNESSSLVSGSTFYGFTGLEIKESNREKDRIKKLITKLEERVIDNKPLVSTGEFYKTFKTYSRYQNRQFKELLGSSRSNIKSTEDRLISLTSKNGMIKSQAINMGLELQSLVKRPKDYKSKTNIDINRNIPKVTSQPSISNANSSTWNSDFTKDSKTLNTSLKKVTKSDKNSNSGYTKQVESFGNRTLDSDDVETKIKFNSSDNNKSESSFNNLTKKIDSIVLVDTHHLNSTLDVVDIATSTTNLKSRNMDTELKSVMSNPRINVNNDSSTTKSLSSLNTSSLPGNTNANGSWRMKQKNGSPRKTEISKKGTLSETINDDSLAASMISCMSTAGASTDSDTPLKSTRLGDASLTYTKTRNADFANTFFKVKSIPTKPKNTIRKLKLSPAKTKLNNNIELDLQSANVNEEFENDQRQIQEESDFEMAKRLQAEFDSIQRPSRTRRGTTRQITLDEMLLV